LACAKDLGHRVLDAAVEIMHEMYTPGSLTALHSIGTKIGISAGKVHSFTSAGDPTISDHHGIPLDIAVRLSEIAHPCQLLIDEAALPLLDSSPGHSGSPGKYPLGRVEEKFLRGF